jgi:hypothetical protein
MGYKRTKREPIHHYIEVYDVDLPDVSLTSTNSVQRIQIVSVPDDRNRRDALSGEPLEAREVREVLVRDPVEIVDCSPESTVSTTYGPYGTENALSEAVGLAHEEDLPIAEEIVTLRPDHWTDSEHWATCPVCDSDEMLLVSDLDDSNMTLACRSCGERAQSDADWKEMHYEWLHCPGCCSGDVNVELSCPYGSVWWSCDDCSYDTLPAPPDTAYTESRDTIESQGQ